MAYAEVSGTTLCLLSIDITEAFDRISVVSMDVQDPEVTSQSRDVNKNGGGGNDLTLSPSLINMQIT